MLFSIPPEAKAISLSPIDLIEDLSIAFNATMPVTVKTADHEASLIPSSHGTTVGSLLAAISRDPRRGDVLQSSFDRDMAPVVRPSSNGFIYSVTEAYNNHYHLVIRPDDIWLAIVTQFSFYVNAHAEELRRLFVAHDGKKTLEVKYECGDRYSTDFADFSFKIAALIEENVVDPDLRQWIAPRFSTTKQQDVVVASIVMMGTLQKYFSYKVVNTCGIPSVTLLGEKEDYKLMLARVEKLCQYGPEPTEFCKLLTPILQGFVRTFENPENGETRDFWRRICSYQPNSSGMSYYSGWITAFCFWDEFGKPRRTMRHLGGQEYGTIDVDDIPTGFTKLPVLIDDNGEQIKAEMLAGSVAIVVTSSGRSSHMEPHTVGLDTMQPRLGWFIYEKMP
ncbi:hypothetical protein BR93DRAFT_932711 [Coniochaeta sp. PMI_546]|nr:hypothetical protein BR93DRAFT_932711 [Coniochaeta sp. PMI_546]